MSKHLVPWKRSVKGYKTCCQKVKHRLGPLSLADAVHPEGTPWILPRLAPGRYWSTEWAHFFSMIRHSTCAQPHITQPVLHELNELGYKVLPRPPYSPDLLPTDYCFFKHLDNFLQRKCFHNQQEAENSFQEFVKSWSMDFFMLQKQTNISHWQKCVDCNGSYFN